MSNSSIFESAYIAMEICLLRHCLANGLLPRKWATAQQPNRCLAMIGGIHRGTVPRDLEPRTKVSLLVPMGPETKNDHAGEGHQQLAGLNGTKNDYADEGQ
jgi:hypothetical protein